MRTQSPPAPSSSFKSQLLELTRPALPAVFSQSLLRYLDVLDRASATRRVPFTQAWYGDAFRQQANNPTWVIQSLISNLVKEGEGATDLLGIARLVSHKRIAAQIFGHAKDEARHCKMYLKIIDTVFPDALPSDCRTAIEVQMPFVPRELHNGLSERIVDPEESVDDYRLMDLLIQVNLGEMRTRIHQKLMSPVLYAYCNEGNSKSLDKLLGSIMKDEARHIVYTGTVIGKLSMAYGAANFEELVGTRLDDFIEYTVRELGTQDRGPL